MNVTRDWNAVRFDAENAEAGHVESYFLKLNDPDGRRALWVKATILSSVGDPRGAVAEAWAIAFDRDGQHVAAKSTVPFRDASFSREGLDVKVAGLTLTTGRVSGEIPYRGRTIAFDLGFSTDVPPLVPYPAAALYERAFPKTKFVTPHPDSRFSGFYAVDGARVEVDTWRGMQGHNWGRAHSEVYGWAHANQWDQPEDLVLEAGSARVRLGPVLTPLATVVCIRHRGVRYDWNHPKDILRTKSQVTFRSFGFRAENDTGRVEAELSGDTSDFVGLYYANPDGTMAYCLNTKIARARVVFEPRGRAPLTLTSRAAALEVATRDPAHGIRMHV